MPKLYLEKLPQQLLTIEILTKLTPTFHMLVVSWEQ
jgi:hypothetical protein